MYLDSLQSPVKIGKHVFINTNVSFDTGNDITIGNYMEIGHGTKFVNQSCEMISDYTNLRPPSHACPLSSKILFGLPVT